MHKSVIQPFKKYAGCTVTSYNQESAWKPKFQIPNNVVGSSASNYKLHDAGL